MRLSTVAISILFFASSAFAQDPWPQEKPEQRQQTVINEDGGRSYLVLPATAPLVSLIKPGQEGVGDVKQRTSRSNRHEARREVRRHGCRWGRQRQSHFPQPLMSVGQFEGV